MQYFNNYEQRCFDETNKALNTKTKAIDHQNAIKNQIKESKSHKQFDNTLNKNIYLELTSLEEQQIDLEKKLEQEKKAAKRNMMQRVISETKIKIAQKKDDIITTKKLEKEEEIRLSKVLAEEAIRDKEIALQKKKDLKAGMDKQFEAIQRIKNDEYELDKLAQKEGDRRADLFDLNQVKKQVVRQDLIKQAVLGNDDILRHKAWKKGMADRDLKEDNKFVKQKASEHERDKKEA